MVASAAAELSLPGLLDGAADLLPMLLLDQLRILYQMLLQRRRRHCNRLHQAAVGGLFNFVQQPVAQTLHSTHRRIVTELLHGLATGGIRQASGLFCRVLEPLPGPG